jgi:hypothetical protein
MFSPNGIVRPPYFFQLQSALQIIDMPVRSLGWPTMVRNASLYPSWSERAAEVNVESGMNMELSTLTNR